MNSVKENQSWLLQGSGIPATVKHQWYFRWSKAIKENDDLGGQGVIERADCKPVSRNLT